MTREITELQIIETVRELCLKANFELRPDVIEALQIAEREEESARGKKVLEQILENAATAQRERLPLCQDTGFVTVFLSIGQDVVFQTADLEEAVNEGVRRAHQEGYLRKSVVAEPLFDRVNTGDNTPVKVYAEIVSGDGLAVTVMPKGGGSDNASVLKMLTPAEGVVGVKQLVLETVRARGADACPPLIIGIGVGGTFDSVGILSKQALLELVGRKNEDPDYYVLEQEILSEVNQLGIGPGGLGGKMTALAVQIKAFPTHIGCLPVAVDLSCHALRSASAIL